MEPTIGEIIIFAGNFAPKGWALCNGQLMSIAQNTALFSLLGTTYGGDGKVTFGLPDLRGTIPSHAGNGPGLSPTNLGEFQGTQTQMLNVTQLPMHAHSALGSVAVLCNNSDEADSSDPTGAFFRQTPGVNTYAGSSNASMGASTATVTIMANGGNQPMNNQQPYLGINYVIALQGIYPSRP
ncbi:phage tail protein [Flavobacterium magnum]|uniref:Phage tail protein n=1 Tax=Flavobacterium magnum TaxID=2162713 RepID=A0A2S0RF69_9FLAO|nr:tail fiber protein [Flavobacterium magnum]AWA29878.1 phage tail protein [Flavobacterium magnum]